MQIEHLVAVSQNMMRINCWKCGILFLAPLEFVRNRSRLGQAFSCPCGHKCVATFKDKQPDELRKENIKLRRERIKNIHEREQAEAREAEKRGGEKSGVSNG